ncbi:hypothetical protein [Actinocorallia herbida]|uniref:hypothetical protein n=1 Tax=Actinocorallia herbida TaxID=58109 RepID=UPI000F4B0D62|nr:hypothetical protein [Actinocorallia herbida]
MPPERAHYPVRFPRPPAEYALWFRGLVKEDLASATQVAQAVAALREEGPTLGRPLVDRPLAEQLYIAYTAEEET